MKRSEVYSEFSKKERLFVLLLCIFIFALLMPYVFAVFFSYPAQDDFTFYFWMETYGEGRNVFSQAVSATKWSYINWTCGIPYVFIQLICNPLLYHSPESYAYGVQMVAVFLLFWTALCIFIRFICINLFGIERPSVILGLFASVMIVILNCDVFQEVFYWYTGRIYMLAHIFAMFTYMIVFKMFKEQGKRLRWLVVAASIAGFVTCFSYQIAVMLGISYLFLFYALFRSDVQKKHSLIKCIPLVFMIAGGLISALGPGNFVRQASYISEVHLASVFKWTLSSFKTLIFTMYIVNPLAYILLILCVFWGYRSAKVRKGVKPLAYLAAGVIASLGMLFPIALGQGSSTLYNRMLFFVAIPTYLFHVVFAIQLGAYAKEEYGSVFRALTERNKRELTGALLAACVLLFIWFPIAFRNKPVRAVYNPIFYSISDLKDGRDHAKLVKDLYRSISDSDSDEIFIDTDSIAVLSLYYPSLLVYYDDFWTNTEMSFYFGKRILNPGEKYRNKKITDH